MGAIFLGKKKKRLRQRTHKLKASRNMGAIFQPPLTPKRHGSTKFHKKVKNLLELAKGRLTRCALEESCDVPLGGVPHSRLLHLLQPFLQ